MFPYGLLMPLVTLISSVIFPFSPPRQSHISNYHLNGAT